MSVQVRTVKVRPLRTTTRDEYGIEASGQDLAEVWVVGELAAVVRVHFSPGSGEAVWCAEPFDKLRGNLEQFAGFATDLHTSRGS